MASLAAIMTAALLPVWWVDQVMEAALHSKDEPTIIGMEVFSGTGELSCAFSSIVGAFETFEKLNCDEEDILKRSGLKLLLQRLSRIQKNGLLWAGTPCKSWVALSRAWTKRSVLQPAGPSNAFTTPAQRAYLDEHNEIATLTAHLLVTAWCMGCYYVLEQPLSFLLFKFPPIAKALAQTGAQGLPMSMAAFGGESPKPLVLKGIGPFLSTFRGAHLIRKASCHKKPSKRLVKITLSRMEMLALQALKVP